jgi:purine-binding chemotaxis protein CheW
MDTCSLSPIAGPMPAPVDDHEPVAVAAGDGEPEQHLTFDLAGEIFAVPVRQVREVLDLQRVARIANAPPLLLGMIDVRGQAIPVLDLARRLAPPLIERSEHTRILVLEVARQGRQLVVATIGDAVHEVAELAMSSLEPPPELGEPWDSSFMRGLGRRDGAFVTLLDLEQVLRGPELAPAAGAP